MSNKTPKPLFASGLYIALSLCVLAVVCIGAYSAVNQLFKGNENTPVIDSDPLSGFNTPTDTLPEENDAPDLSVDLPLEIPEEETNAEEKEEDGEQEVATEPVTPERIYLSPIAEATVAKEFQIEELLYSATMNDYRTHTGVDLKAEVGCTVRAFTDGVVESIHADPLMGQTLILNHGNGLKSIYQNLALEIPEGILAGAEVKAGDLIGAIGETAIIECAEESHLHFELQQDEACIDPADYLDWNA